MQTFGIRFERERTLLGIKACLDSLADEADEAGWRELAYFIELASVLAGDIAAETYGAERGLDTSRAGLRRPAPAETTISGPRGFPLVGVLPQLWRDPLGFFMDTAREYGDITFLNLGFNKAFLLNHPNHIKHVLQDNYRNYRKSSFIEKLKPLLGEGLLTSDGELWTRQRQLLQPGFRRERLQGLAHIMTEVIAAMIVRWGEIREPGATIDLAGEMSRVALEVIVKTMFSTDIGAEAAKVSEAITVLQAHASSRVWAFTDLTERIPTRRNRRFRQALRTLDEVVYRIIDGRRRGGKDKDDLLSMLLAARDADSGEGMNDRQLRDEVMTMFVAGHETTANALSWIWYLLGQYPEAAMKVHQEAATTLKGGMPSLEDLPNLVYTKMVIQECLRLLPSIWWYARTAIEDDQIGSCHIPAGSTVIISQYLTHRHPAFWEDPETFDPERFAPENVVGRPPYAYFPFGGGPRVCIGKHFAMLEIQLLVPIVAQAYRLEPVPGRKVELEPYITLRPRNGLPMTLRDWSAEPDTANGGATPSGGGPSGSGS
jgi:cytochrome P450